MTDMNKLCWICGGLATTGEHQHKKTDVIALFGDRFSKSVVKVSLDGKDKKIVQGPNSKALKYQNSLCAQCNTTTTQPYDDAYMTFAAYIREKHRSITRELEINMNLVFGRRDARERQQHLFRYFAKVFGCQLYDAGISVPQALTNIFMQEDFGNTYSVSICMNSKKLNGLATFDLVRYQNEDGNHVGYHWAQDNGWFTIVHAYNWRIPLMWGQEWSGKSKKMVVGKWNETL